MRAEGCEGWVDFFVALHFASCQPKMIKGEGTKRPLSFGNVNFQIRPQYCDTFPVNAINDRWYTSCLQRWFYYNVCIASALGSTNRDIVYVPKLKMGITDDSLLRDWPFFIGWLKR